jgi:transcriptional regulator with XRE-family HTH domain
MSIGERLKIIRGEMTQFEFAEQLSVHPNTVARYERGERSPDSEYIDGIYKRFSVNPRWLLTGKGQMRIDVKRQFYGMLDGLFGKRHVQLLDRIRQLLNEQMKKDPQFSDDMSVNVSAASFGILFKKDDSWLTDENIRLAMEMIIQLYNNLYQLKKMDITEGEIEEAIGFLLNPERCETDMESGVLAEFNGENRKNDAGREGKKGRSKKMPPKIK